MLRIAVLASGRGSNLQALVDAIASRRLDARIDMSDGRLSVAAPEGTLVRIVTPGGAVRELPAPCEVAVAGPVRVELLRRGARWILSSPLGGAQSPSSA